MGELHLPSVAFSFPENVFAAEMRETPRRFASPLFLSPSLTIPHFFVFLVVPLACFHNSDLAVIDQSRCPLRRSLSLLSSPMSLSRKALSSSLFSCIGIDRYKYDIVTFVKLIGQPSFNRFQSWRTFCSKLRPPGEEFNFRARPDGGS